MQYAHPSVVEYTLLPFQAVNWQLCVICFHLCSCCLFYNRTRRHCSFLSYGFTHLAGRRRCSESVNLCVRSRAQGPVPHPQCGDRGVSCCCCLSAGTQTFCFHTHCPCLLHHGNSTIPQGFCCARPSLCGQFRTNHLLLMASHESVLSCGNVGSPCCYLRKRMVDFCCSPSPKWRGWRPPLFPCIHQILPTPILHPTPALLPSNYFPAFLSCGCVDGHSALT